MCPVIPAFLSSYNDHVDDRERQDLYPHAARAVGTRSYAAGNAQQSGFGTSGGFSGARDFLHELIEAGLDVTEALRGCSWTGMRAFRAPSPAS